jgi:hypothetical protein
LIAHRITLGECQKRQRENYHKCWTCTHRNASWFHQPVPERNGKSHGTDGTANGKNGHVDTAVRNGATNGSLNGSSYRA